MRLVLMIGFVWTLFPVPVDAVSEIAGILAIEPPGLTAHKLSRRPNRPP